MLFETRIFQPTRPLRGATVILPLVEFSKIFQPTRPLRGATVEDVETGEVIQISTHAPLAGRDCCVQFVTPETNYFNPRAPCGARHGLVPVDAPCGYFNPRAPCGARPIDLRRALCLTDFNPRAPCGARQQKCTNHYAHFCDNRQISDVFAQNADCQGILFLFCARKTCKF